MKGNPEDRDAWGEMGTKRAVERADPQAKPAPGSEGDDELSEQWGGGLPRQRKKRGGKAEGRMETKRLDRKLRKAGGKLTAADRHALPSKDFALPGERYPIEDISHGRNALARVSQHGSPEEKAKVRAAVHRKFPEIGESKD